MAEAAFDSDVSRERERRGKVSGKVSGWRVWLACVAGVCGWRVWLACVAGVCGWRSSVALAS